MYEFDDGFVLLSEREALGGQASIIMRATVYVVLLYSRNLVGSGFYLQ